MAGFFAFFGVSILRRLESRAEGAGGATPATPVQVESFTWGNIELKDLTLMEIALDRVCGLVDPTIAGIIGSDILSRFRFTVDYQARHLVLESPAA